MGKNKCLYPEAAPILTNFDYDIYILWLRGIVIEEKA